MENGEWGMLDCNNLVAWWPLEGGPDSVKGTFTTTSVGTETYTEMPFGRGRRFEVNGRLECNQKVNPTGAKSVEFWLRSRDSFGASNYWVYGTANNSGDLGTQILLLTSGEISFRGNKGTSGIGNFAVNAQLATDTLYHICCTWDGTANASGVKLYVDGILVSSGQANDITDGNTHNCAIAGRLSNALRLRADIDELRAWDTALPISDVRRVMLNMHPISL